MGRIRELDGLRAVAILLVLGCHFGGFSQLAWKLPEFGWLGVEVFFALSGYLITTILLGLRNRSTPYKTFYSRRLVRILPSYLVVMLVLIPIGIHEHWLTKKMLLAQLLFLQAYTPQIRHFLLDLARHPYWHLTHLPNLLAGAHRLPAGLAGLPPDPRYVPNTLWSLSVEEYFYLLWAPIVLRFSKSTVVWVGVSVCALEMLLRWMVGTEITYFGLAYRFDSLLYGAFLALLLHHWRSVQVPKWGKTMFSSILLASLTGLAFILFAIRPFVGYEIRDSPLVMVVGLPLFSIAVTGLLGLLILEANTSWWLARLLRSRPMQRIGTVSYTMYLVHILAAFIIYQAILALGLSLQPSLQALLAAVLTLAIAQISWRYLEGPMLQWKDRKFPNSPHPPAPASS